VTLAVYWISLRFRLGDAEDEDLAVNEPLQAQTAGMDIGAVIVTLPVAAMI